MRLYERDYQVLTPEEEAERLECVRKCAGIHRNFDYFAVPKAVVHYRTLFPNNYLNPHDLAENYVISAINEFEALLDKPDVSERQVLNFIKERRYYFIIGSLLRAHVYGFGHHAAYLFPEFQLGNSFIVDYLIIGKGSNGYEFVFVELESPVKATVTDGGLGEAFRKGIRQLDDWKHWLEENFSALRTTFEKEMGSLESLPREFHVLDTTRLHFVVVAGRRENFNNRTYRLAREERGKGTRRILHYDHLIDSGRNMTKAATY